MTTVTMLQEAKKEFTKYPFRFENEAERIVFQTILERFKTETELTRRCTCRR